MEWLHEPREWAYSEGDLVLRTDPKTDFWRITHDGQVRDSGHFFYQTVKGDCTARAHLEGAFIDLYDQVGLMLRADERNWLKCGIEFVGGEAYRSVVVTRDFSDWSVVPNAGESGLWVRIVRQGETVEVSVSRDGEDYSLSRQAYFPATESVGVGLMAASPIGSGFEARIRGFSVQ